MASKSQPLPLARDYFEREDYGKAFSMYLMAKIEETEGSTASTSGINCSMDAEFLICAGFWLSALVNTERIKEFFSCLHTALSVFSNEITKTKLLQEAGSLLFGHDYAYEASLVFKLAQKETPDSLEVSEYLDRINNYLVKRWHFRMLNDRDRNEAYQTAIALVLSKKTNLKILDIGSGTGVLSMFCAAFGDSSNSIYAVEASRTFYDICNSALVENGLSTKVHTLNKLSTELEKGIDTPNKCDVIVTEIFDCGLLGEGVIPTLLHALQYITEGSSIDSLSDEKKLSPAPVEQMKGLTVCTQDDKHDDKVPKTDTDSKKSKGKQTPTVQKEGKANPSVIIPHSAVVFAALVECEELRAHNGVCQPVSDLSYKGVKFIGSRDPEDTEDKQPYSSEFMSSIRGGFTYLSDVTKITEFTFGDYEELKRKVKSTSKHSLTLIKSGSLDAIITWFQLNLCDSVVLETSPLTDSCWEQAVYNIQESIELHKISSQVKKGDVATLQCRCTEDYLELEITEIERTQSFASEVSATPGRVQRKSSRTEYRVIEEEIPGTLKVYLDRRMTRRLNDVLYYATYAQAIQDFVLPEGSLCAWIHTPQAICLAPKYSILPVLTLRSANVVLPGASEDQLDFVKKMCAANGINFDNVQGIHESLMLYASKSTEDVWLAVFELVDPNGLIKDGIFGDIDMLRNFVLQPDATLIPCGFCLHGQLVSSRVLRRNTTVINDDVTMGFKVKDFINEYKVTTFPDIDLLTLEHEPLSEEVELLSFPFSDSEAWDQDGEVLPVVRNSENVEVTRSGKLTALVYWFDINVSDTLKISTKSSYETHWHQAAVVLPCDVAVEAGDTLQLKVTLHGNNIHVTFEKDGELLM